MSSRRSGMPFNSYHSPPLTPFVDELPRLPKVISPTRMVAAGGRHRFHRDLGRAPSAGFGGLSHHGPHHRDAGRNGAADPVRQQPAQPPDGDRRGHHSARSVRKGPAPTALVIHLHGAPNRPEHDGFPTSPFRLGRGVDYQFTNPPHACPLWYHDHSMGTTRLSIYAGLSGHYHVRDQWDTGTRDNPLACRPAGTRPRSSSATSCSTPTARCATTTRGPFRPHWAADCAATRWSSTAGVAADAGRPGLYRFSGSQSASQLTTTACHCRTVRRSGSSAATAGCWMPPCRSRRSTSPPPNATTSSSTSPGTARSESPTGQQHADLDVRADERLRSWCDRRTGSTSEPQLAGISGSPTAARWPRLPTDCRRAAPATTTTGSPPSMWGQPAQPCLAGCAQHEPQRSRLGHQRLRAPRPGDTGGAGTS